MVIILPYSSNRKSTKFTYFSHLFRSLFIRLFIHLFADLKIYLLICLYTYFSLFFLLMFIHSSYSSIQSLSLCKILDYSIPY